MKFEKLYDDCRERISASILGMWKETSPEMVDLYQEQLKQLINGLVSENIVVENMAHWEEVENDDWRRLVNPKIWREWNREHTDIQDRTFSPYKHQYNCWKALLDDEKSIVVTSGTGSGKTECFMVPLIEDLTRDKQNNDSPRTEAVEAIFLYPLNALMEDQKERIEDYITFSEKPLKFTVFNGNTPENRQSPKYNESPFANEIVTREEIRRNKPNILFTNPSMLEYMLLRKKDYDLFTDKLKWIVIDETHTYKGAAGAELAMLIRRVLKACGIDDVNKVKFATSSATIGNAPGAEEELKKFISDITGQDKGRIERIDGHRSFPKVNDEHCAIGKKLQKDEFVYLKELVPNGDTASRLRTLDELSDEELRIRIHYYLKTINFGLYVDPRNTQEGRFLLTDNIPLAEGKLDSHYLDAYYCKECGALLGFGEIDNNHNYHRKMKDVIFLDDMDDMDDMDDDDDDDATANNPAANTSGEFYVGLRRDGDNAPSNLLWNLDEATFINEDNGQFRLKNVEYNRRGEKVHMCPCCGAKGVGKHRPMSSFHLSADFISRLLAPIFLEHTTPSKNGADTLPSCGRKYITFADSRQSVAGPTLKQNLETEEVWVTGVLHRALNDLTLTPMQREKLKREEEAALKNGDGETYYKLHEKLVNAKSYITWIEAVEALKKDPNSDMMYLAFAKGDDRVTDEDRRKYLLSALFRVMQMRAANGANSPENMGILCTTYPDLDGLKNRELPDVVKRFNELIPNDPISKEDWYDYVKIFVDTKIRRDGTLFFDGRTDRNRDWDNIDIESCRSYRTDANKRRSFDSEENKVALGSNRHTKLLMALLGRMSVTELKENERTCIEDVIEQLKKDLREYHIIENGRLLNWVYNRNSRKYEINGWRDTTEYMNLTRMAFTLYDSEVWFDEKLYIPLSTTFKHISPESYEKCVRIPWPAFNKAPNESSKDWFERDRTPIVRKWTNKLGRILDYSPSYPNTLYIQAEHTAQVARSIIKQKVDKFKAGEINIMACSTTMEMGVDLGDLELVLMNNVPPHPANYKQRAGRAGRRTQNKSASVTICGSDASGEALMRDPVKSLICAPIDPPTVDLSSPQLVQRHVNSYLFHRYIREKDVDFAPGGEGENDRGYKVCMLFTSYDVRKVQQGGGFIACAYNSNNQDVYPGEYTSLLDDNTTHYKTFINKLDDWSVDDIVTAEVKNLVRNTLGGNINPTKLIRNTKDAIKLIAEDLDKELLAIKEQWMTKGCDHHNNNTPWKTWNYRFTSVLQSNLLTYLSTHQFTPNANMPIGIVEMVLDDNERHNTENPSRDLRTALSEYAPGRLVFINDVTYRMGGVRWNRAQSNERLKRCVNNHTWLGSESNCPQCSQPAVDWGGSFGRYIEIIKPTGFHPYKETSRITQKDTLNIYLDTALIGVGDWNNNQCGDRLYLTRTNGDNVESQILYYNKGVGQGYYVCKECGFAVPVPTNVNNQNVENTIMDALYPLFDRRSGEHYHNYRGQKCLFDGTRVSDDVFKNIVFGGTIQTDYCEIALREEVNKPLKFSEENYQVATTLGVMLSRKFANQIGCERNEIDFFVRNQDGALSICIYDTAKGGNGYSKRIGDNPHRIDGLLDDIRMELDGCTSANRILDRQTMKYADFVNVDATYRWLEKEYQFRRIVPDAIQCQFPNSVVRVSCYDDMRRAFVQAQQSRTLLFKGNSIHRWNLKNGDVSWNSVRSKDLIQGNIPTTYAVYGLPTQIASYQEDYMKVVSGGADWKKYLNYMATLYPVAHIDNVLYFTEDANCALLDGAWAAKQLYSVDCNNVQLGNLQYVLFGDDHCVFESDMEIKSDDIFDIVYNGSSRVRDFIAACRGGSLTFKYHEEYMYNHLAMAMAVQFMLKFAERANARVEKIECLGEEYDIDYRRPIRITHKFPSSGDRDRYLIEKFLKPLRDGRTIQQYNVQSLPQYELPHWRALIVRDNDSGTTINILPNGGFYNEWMYNGGDGNNNIHRYYARTQIPIRNAQKILYDIKVCKPLWE